MIEQNIIELKEKLLILFEQYFDTITQNDSHTQKLRRRQAIQRFNELGFPNSSMEKWRNTPLNSPLNYFFDHSINNISENIDIHDVFHCEVPDLKTSLIIQYNGWIVGEYFNKSNVHEKGFIIGSLQKARMEYPQLVEQYYNSVIKDDDDGLKVLNTAFAQDGLFIYVPDNTVIDTPIQLVNIVDSTENLFLNPRHLIIVGKNSKLTLVHCDHSIKHRISFINSHTEVVVLDNGIFNYYKLENKDNNSALLAYTYIEQKRDSNVHSNTIALNGGIVRNETFVNLSGSNANAEVLGLFLTDKNQHVDNQVYIRHSASNCSSNELFKGILDDESSAVFNGHIYVAKDAQKTSAYQNNKNILLSDTAKINTKPFLEIYADDVKCSHGATVGQLDQEALYYLKSRGIDDKKARNLLMYAFAHEVIKEIKIDVLRERIDTMTEKRLKGELSICDQCLLSCSAASSPTFNIDFTKI